MGRWAVWWFVGFCIIMDLGKTPSPPLLELLVVISLLLFFLSLSFIVARACVCASPKEKGKLIIYPVYTKQ